MRNFSSITEAELCKMVKQRKPSTCCLDPVPTKFLKNVFNSVSRADLKIINTSVQTGIFPNAFKTGVKCLLKNLDYNVLSNYRPISNVPFISKILKVFLSISKATF